jgi:hypothetical protein
VDPRVIVKSKIGLAAIIVAHSNQAVFLAAQDQRDPDKFVGDYLNIEETEQVIRALQEALDKAKADRDFQASLTPEQKCEMIDRALGKFIDASEKR